MKIKFDPFDFEDLDLTEQQRWTVRHHYKRLRYTYVREVAKYKAIELASELDAINEIVNYSGRWYG